MTRLRQAATLLLLALAIPPLWIATTLAAPVMRRLYQEIGLEP